MDNLLPMVSLVIIDEAGNEQKLKMKSTKGEIIDAVALPILDYMLSSYRDLDRYLEAALQNHWFNSSNVTVKIVGTDDKEYALPFENKNTELIFRCSESASYRGKNCYIEKGDAPKQVSNQEFEGFFNEFISNVLDDVGYELISQGFFEKWDGFTTLLNEYHSLNEKEDDMYASSRANALEKSFYFSKTPATIEDYLRHYAIFREALFFNQQCQILRNERRKIEEEKRKEQKIQGKKIAPKTKEKVKLVEKHEASYFAEKRSLCYIIGNNCEPLILETLLPDELDDFITEHFNNAKEVRREYQEKIKAYILKHKAYVQEIRELIQNEQYSGQVAILAHQEDGGFIRLSDGTYLRYPVVYSKTFKQVKDLYCNIDRFRKQYTEISKKDRILTDRIGVKRAEKNCSPLVDKLTEVIEQLEEDKRITKEELTTVLGKINTIISDMQDLEEADYKRSADNLKYGRIFSPHISKSVRFVSATAIKPSYKMHLDEWARQLQDSPYRYDEIRFIMRHLRKKKIFD